MGVFVEPPFWALPYGRAVAPHAVAVRVVPDTPPTEPLSLALAKNYARLGANVDLDAILPTVLTTCRLKVEQDTGIALVPTTFDLFFDALPWDRSTPITLPWRPVTSVTSVKSYDTAGVLQTLDVSNYLLDPGSDTPVAARLGLTIAGSWPTDLRPFQPYVIRIVAGYADPADIPPPLLHAVGLAVDAYVNKLPLDGYEEAIAGYKLVTVA